MVDFNPIVLSHATYLGPSGATAAATYSFMTSEYKPPSQERHFSTDVVHNQNGKFKYLYDNGPGFSKWSPFNIHCELPFQQILQATAAVQFAHLLEMWNHKGVLGMKDPEGVVHTIHWAEGLDRSFRVFPRVNASQIERIVAVQFDEGQA